MENELSIIESPQKRLRFFRRSKVVRLSVYLPLLCVIGFFWLRWFESTMTQHPTPYSPDQNWTLPAGAEDVWFAGLDGKRLHGWFVHARTQPAAITVLYCHGNAGNIADAGWIAERLAARGLDVLLFDYRGYGRSEGKASDEWGLYADANAAYDYLTRERGVAPERLALYGLSLGTTAVIDVASRRACASLVVESGLSSASEMASIALPWLPRWLHWLGKNRFESARKIASVGCPVLIAHGTRDETIPVEQGRALYQAAPEPKRLLLINGGDHFLPNSGGDSYLDSITDFMLDPRRSIS